MHLIRTKCDLCGGKKFTASAVATYEINKYGKLEQTSNVLDDDFVHCTDPLCPAVYNKDEFKIQEEKKPDPSDTYRCSPSDSEEEEKEKED